MGIKIEKLDYVYMQGSPFERKALDNINLEINDGEFIGLIGHTGSGKSTLVQHLNGLLKPHGGSVVVNGRETTTKGEDLKKLRCEVGLVFQYPEHQLFEETVYKDIAFGPANLGLSKEEIDQRVKEAMNYVGLSYDLMEKSPFDLSGGQKRRAAIAGVLSMHPSVLVLDEPTAGLDPAGREEILTQVKSIYLKSKMTVILVSHSMEDVAKLVNRLIVMNQGRVAMDGPVSEVFAHGDELRGMGLNVPQVHLLVDELIKRGVPLSKNIYTVEKAKAALMVYFNKQKEGTGNA
ncbi:energy-coupling factor transporter ATPase [Congzhengia minquanensis]|uniref:Energy-coupling factor transporter ATP-binding protein EcfA2 n=1 Tax=Congzhengia minquanensis TaxID=2763657 RepID=A0A926DKU3_9FIRM|nr:energy-coupling factor transporter ATPase [Congzhengia minquanensis]